MKKWLICFWLGLFLCLQISCQGQDTIPTGRDESQPTVPFTSTSALPTATATATYAPATETATLAPSPVPPSTTPTRPPTSTPEPTPVQMIDAKDLVGVWFGPGMDGMYFRFNQDGTCRLAYVLKNLDSAPNISCTYRFENGDLIFTEVKVSGVPACPEATAVYHVMVYWNGNIKFKVVEDSCTPRMRTMVRIHEPVEE